MCTLPEGRELGGDADYVVHVAVEGPPMKRPTVKTE